MDRRTVTDGDGTWVEDIEAEEVTSEDGETSQAIRVRSRQLVTPSAAYLAGLAAERSPLDAARAAEQARAGRAIALLAKLDGGTATTAEMRACLADLIRFVGSHTPRI